MFFFALPGFPLCLPFLYMFGLEINGKTLIRKLSRIVLCVVTHIVITDYGKKVTYLKNVHKHFALV
jgi:hypothetical protein